MTWTTDYPTKPGFYWIRNFRIADSEGEFSSTLDVAEFDDDLEFYITGNEFHYRQANVLKAEWQGPIEPDAEKPVQPSFYRSIRLRCRDCAETDRDFVSWNLGFADDRPVIGIICRECWIKRLTPEQRKVYMV